MSCQTGNANRRADPLFSRLHLDTIVRFASQIRYQISVRQKRVWVKGRRVKEGERNRVQRLLDSFWQKLESNLSIPVSCICLCFSQLPRSCVCLPRMLHHQRQEGEKRRGETLFLPNELRCVCVFRETFREAQTDLMRGKNESQGRDNKISKPVYFTLSQQKR